jgi:hypothetical protein
MGQGTDERQAVSAREAELTLSKRAGRTSQIDLLPPEELQRLALATAGAVEKLEEEIGEPPTALKPGKGSGLWLALDTMGARIDKRLDAMAAEIGAVKQGLDTDRSAAKALADRREAAIAPYSRVGWTIATVAISVLVTSGMGAVIYFVSTLHH